jgi:hypothetical protein
MLNYGAPFGFVFKDKDWFKKFVIASLLTCTLIGAAPIIGWTIETARRVSQGEEPALPELKDWKSFWNLGGKFALVNAIWLIPLLFAVILLYLPLIFVNSFRPEMLLLIFGGTLCFVLFFLLVYSLSYAFFFPAMVVALANGDSSWKAMNPVYLWKVARLDFSAYLMIVLIVGIALSNVILLLSAFTLFLLLPPMLVYAGLVTAHFVGQYRVFSHLTRLPPGNILPVHTND